jgi:DNA-directed RNA polymerase specialized sigma24 family protein
MPVDEDILEAAQRHYREPLEALLAYHYPVVHRMSMALSGRVDVARGVERFVLNRVGRVLGQWRDASSAERWFYHHTILTSRRAQKHGPKDDLLVSMEGAADPPYIAFVRAIRALPVQAREAILMHQGEGWDLRAMSVAMDCSTHATQVHLQLAEHTLRAVAGETYDAMVARLKAVYQKMSPATEDVMPIVRRAAARVGRPRRMKRIVVMLVVAGILAIGLWLWTQLARQ